MAFRAVLFDLDGTLVDSEAKSARALAQVLARDVGVDITPEDRDFVIGHSWNEIYERLGSAYHAVRRLSLVRLIEHASRERTQIIAREGLAILPGAVAAVLRISLAKAVVTGSSRQEAGEALAHLGVRDRFQAVLAAEDYRPGKPAPDGYLKAAMALGAAPRDCLVLEDSTAGIAAGRAAGMTVVALRAGNFRGQDQAAAHYVLDTLDEVTEDFLVRAAGAR